MKKHWLKILGGILLVLVILFFTVVPRYADALMNARANEKTYLVSDKAWALHESLRIADLHADSMLWKRDFLEERDYGLVDLHRAQQGKMAVQVFGIVTKVPPWTREGATADMRDQVTPLVIANGWQMRT